MVTGIYETFLKFWDQEWNGNRGDKLRNINILNTIGLKYELQLIKRLEVYHGHDACLMFPVPHMEQLITREKVKSILDLLIMDVRKTCISRRLNENILLEQFRATNDLLKQYKYPLRLIYLSIPHSDVISELSECTCLLVDMKAYSHSDVLNNISQQLSTTGQY
jgi:hypothetical protein